ncbi:cytochrome P450 [Bradyrhizobium diazoefficiens]|uniref:cytochrome P450 n=1 Tax=Bradyrhizobium diazoefficiens TaxID=1355477 RepID=UPI00272A2CD7|nr:cytochrome P450 [Bradyrhizobium diazoefficiens]WLA68591.1 cytochrome P450 [Bradyrhizobium diazoefficiens]
MSDLTGHHHTDESVERESGFQSRPSSFERSRTSSADFDPDDLQPSGWSKRLEWIFDEPHWLFWLLREFWPIPRLFGWAAVTRYDDVAEVLEQDDVFQVPFGEKVQRLNGGPNFLLGMQRDSEYWVCQEQVMQAFRRDDVAKIIAPLAKQASNDIIARSEEAGKGRVDAIESLITRVPIVICCEYYGIRVPEPQRIDFGRWLIAMSLYTFGNPLDNPRYERAAIAAAIKVRELVDSSIEYAKGRSVASDTVVDRLVKMQAKNAKLTDPVIRSYLIGMMTGFVPTNTMAAGHMLVMLLRRPKFMKAAKEAAMAGDDERLKRCLFEAMRFMPLNPGPFRICASDYTVAAGTSRNRTIKKGTKVLAGTESAMFDNRRVTRPRTFNPDRPSTDYMLFGHGLHWCVGAFIAEAQITQTFKALLVQKNLRPSRGGDGKLKTLGPFPWHLTVEFDV